ncbi:DeoR/GlpR family DNA-binding transcription regulator [Agromyces agglutinans]|uniref:DeoR/GlpR family DNA-binding transcription regulator n=1 Tax=Agromyces agglutinans TaxID=2662258 RepID=UPI0015624090|nr:DeoR/GlpR family DNA-binding transcription regulator [Agromyces agglutinans]
MDKAERQQRIVAIVQQRGEARLADLEADAGASAVTLRRDLRELAARGRISYVRGVARARTRHTLEPSFHEKSLVAMTEKALIGRAAAELVMDGDAVIIGPGTTTLEFATQLVGRHIQVWTNSILVADALADAATVDVHLAGGEVRGATRSLVGSRAERFFNGLRAPLAFLSGNGFTVERGLTTPNARVAEIDRAMAAAAAEVVALVDHTKIGAESLITTVSTSHVSRLITDDAASSVLVEQARRAGVQVEVVSGVG